jgi:hypothetical protein
MESGKKGVRVASALEEMSGVCLAGTLTFFDTPKEWVALQQTCKKLYSHTCCSGVAWGMRNAEFRFTPISIAKYKDVVMATGKKLHIRKVCAYNIGVSELDFILQLGGVTELSLVDAQNMAIFHLCNHFSGPAISRLTTLGLYGGSSGDDGAKAIAEALKSNTSFIALYFNCRAIGTDGVKAIAEMLKSNTSLTTLKFRYNEIGDDGAKAIAEALKSNTSLTTLNLHTNEIGVDGAKAIAEALKSNTSLTTLNLGGNRISVDGAKAIAEALKSNTSLTTLNLWYNEISDDGAKAIAEALKSNTSLTTLNLGGNRIGVDGANAFVDALNKSNTNLIALNIQRSALRRIGGTFVLVAH